MFQNRFFCEDKAWNCPRKTYFIKCFFDTYIHRWKLRTSIQVILWSLTPSSTFSFRLQPSRLELCVTIHTMRKTSSLSKPLKMLLSLAVSDPCVILLPQPLHIACAVVKLKQNTESNPTFTETISITYHTTANQLFALASLFGVVALSADKFLAIYLHLRYQELVTHKRVVAFSDFNLGVPCNFFVGRGMEARDCWWRDWDRYWGCLLRNTDHNISKSQDIFCRTTARTPLKSMPFKYNKQHRVEKGRTLGGSEIAGTTIYVYLIFFICYSPSICIFWIGTKTSESSTVIVVVKVCTNTLVVANVGRLRKTAVTTVYVYLVFLMCCLPVSCTLWINALFSESNTVLDVIQLYFLTLVFLNSSLNPLIYCYKMRHIRLDIINIDTLNCIFTLYNWAKIQLNNTPIRP